MGLPFGFRSVSVLEEHCDFEDTGFGLWVGGCVGNGTLSNTVTIRYNRFHNLDPRVSDGKGGYRRLLPDGPNPGRRTRREDHALPIVRDEFRPPIP
jgi:hypothetical protein